MKAIWNGTVLAESDDTVLLEGNHYFPPDSLHREHLRESPRRTHCAWKGEASYFDLVAGGAINADGAWTYREPSPAAAQIRDRVAFRKGVEVVA